MNDRSKAVLVTGLAASTALGEGAEPFLDGVAGQSPAGNLLNGADRRFHPLPEEVATHPRIRSTHPLTMRLVWTVEHGLGGFLAALSDEERERTGVSVGHAYGHLSSYFEYFDAATQQGYRLVHPLRFLSTLTNYAAAEINNAYSLWGSSIPVGTGWNSGLEAIGAAVHSLEQGDEEAMITGGFDEVSECTRQVLQAVGTAHTAGASPNGKAVPAGEGIGLLLLQRRDAARRAGRRVLAEIGTVAGAHGLSWEEAGAVSIAADAVRRSLAAAGVRAEDVDVLFSSAVAIAGGTGLCEAIQAAALGPVSVPRIDVSATAGECFAATGPLQCISAVAAVAPGAFGERFRSGDAYAGARENQGPARVALVFTAAGDGAFSSLVVKSPPAAVA